jgi:superfamily II DNA or RNA helicase
LKFGYNENQISKFTGKGGSSDHKTIIISNKQYLLKHEDELPEIGCVIADEVHEIKEGSRTFTYIEHLETPFKFGCSGSIPKIVEDKPEKTYQRWCIESLFGSVVNKKTIKELQDEGYIAQLKINHIYIVDREIEKHPNRYKFSIDGGNREDDDEFNTAYLAELEYFKNNAVRLYSKPTKMLTRLKGNTLVLFDRIEFGTKVFDYLNKYIEHTGSEKNAYYIDGRVDVDIREDIRVSSESCDDNIIMAQTRTFSTGLTINNLHNVVFMFNSKAEATILQSIGRSLGLHESKEFANLYDISFNTKYATKQYMERLLTYMEEYHKEKPDKDVVVYI